MSDEALTVAFQAASYHAKQLILSKALAIAGYGDVESMGRRLPGQRSKHGGFELLCRTRFQGREAKVLVKLINEPIRIRDLDQMVGVVLRMGADRGIIITARHLTRTADLLLNTYDRFKVGVFEGGGLAGMLRELRIGTRGDADVDYAYFEHMEQVSQEFLRLLKALGNDS